LGQSVAMERSSSTGRFYPTARCAGGPLPRPAFRSFLATAGDGLVCFRKTWHERRAPPSPGLSPTNCVGER
jgi:hypothetical protein